MESVRTGPRTPRDWAGTRGSPCLDYGGLHRGLRKGLVTGMDVIYLYDGWQVLEEREWDSTDSKWEPRRQYVEGGTYIDEHLIFDKDTDNDGDCTDAGGSERYFYCQQANWNVVAVTDSSGDTVEKIDYDPYGEATVTVQPGKTASGNPYLFQGRRWDDEVSLYYFRNRVLSPVLGRFLQRDAIGHRDSLNIYHFERCQPTRSIDPLGYVTYTIVVDITLDNKVIMKYKAQMGYDCEARSCTNSPIGLGWFWPNGSPWIPILSRFII